jgi:hypothetical protein
MTALPRQLGVLFINHFCGKAWLITCARARVDMQRLKCLLRSSTFSSESSDASRPSTMPSPDPSSPAPSPGSVTASGFVTAPGSNPNPTSSDPSQSRKVLAVTPIV